MSNPIEKDFNLGGSVDKALAGDFELKSLDVIREAWQLTMQNLLRFSPAVLILIGIQAVIFFFALKMQVGDLSNVLNMFQDPETLDPSIFQSIFVANFSYEVITAPIYAGIAMMAMSHAAGLKTETRHITKG
ncbi:probable proline and glycine rich transmembrane protein [Vibrio sp. JCM 19236]|nr:probable proline and glycine rich transmembrane protein [Vibrio sp. JCM 19236]